jgi:hypothetical protein
LSEIEASGNPVRNRKKLALNLNRGVDRFRQKKLTSEKRREKMAQKMKTKQNENNGWKKKHNFPFKGWQNVHEHLLEK